MDEINIIDFEMGCLDKLAKLYDRIVSAPPWNEEWKSLNIVKEYLLEIINTPNFIGHVALVGDEPVGMLFGNIKSWWTGRSFYIAELLVDIDRQRAGIGTHLIAKIESIMHNENVSSLYLYTKNNVPAFQFYKKLGFELDDSMCMFSKGRGTSI